MKVLEVEGLTCRFGRLAALEDVGMQVDRGELRALIGPNGAGKTTFLHAVSGFVRPSAGRILLADQRIDRLPAHRRANLGLRRTFQTPNLCNGLSVLDNVVIGAFQELGSSSLARLFRLRRPTRLSALRERARAALERVDLANEVDAQASSLSYGRIRLLEIGRALMGDPKLLLLDEPVAGMSETERADVAGVIRGLRDDGVTVLLVEHDMEFVMGLVDRVTVLDAGRLLAEGTPAEILANEEVETVYLGTKRHRVGVRAAHE